MVVSVRGALPAGGGVVDVHRVDANQAGVVLHEPAGTRLLASPALASPDRPSGGRPALEPSFGRSCSSPVVVEEAAEHVTWSRAAR
jgi:hypothetical protein